MNLRPLLLSILFVGTWIIWPAARAQELFLPVAGTEDEEVRLENSHYLATRLYGANRHRIVRINDELLRNSEGETVVVNFFNDEQQQYVIKDSLTLDSAVSDKVEVTLVDSDVAVQGFRQADPAIDIETARRLARGYNDVTVSVMLWVRDKLHDRYWPVSALIQPHWPGVSVSHCDLRSVLADDDFVPGFIFSATLPVTSARYVLRPLPANPEYHVLWEEGTARSSLKRTDPSAPPLDDEAQASGDAYDQFRRSLEPAPGADTEMEDLRRFIDHLKNRSNTAQCQAGPHTKPISG